jgi:hypothetical protein
MWKNTVERDRPQTKIDGRPRPEYRHAVSMFNTSTAVQNILWLDNSAIGTNFSNSMAKLKTLVFFTATSTPTIMKKGKYCCISTATMVTRTRHMVTPYVFVYLVKFSSDDMWRGIVCCASLSTNKPIKVKVKVKFTIEQATKAQRGSRGTALLFL